MAVAPTGAIYKSLIFDGEHSRNYGVYITGEAVYNAPIRDVEMVSIPGRSGSFALDKGRFENVEVTYPAGIFADNEADFARAVSDFRNCLCSRKGYCRLTDEYNPDEYRMAIYKSGLEVTPAQRVAGEFNIVFDCKPQRYLMGGEAAIDVSDGDALFNPTLFDASPLLAVKGYGTIGFNGYEIELDNATLGEIQLYRGATYSTTALTRTFTLDTTNLNSGDIIYANDDMQIDEALTATHASFVFNGVTASTNVKSASGTARVSSLKLSIVPDLSAGFVYGTPSTITSSAEYSYRTYSMSGDATETISVSVTYNGTSTLAVSVTMSGTLPSSVTRKGRYDVVLPAIYGYSTKSLLGNPTYIDCDLGEAYRIDGETITSLNQHIDLGSDLPKLASGPNEITADNTITELKITPRWWRV